jgi:hypothetical protein
MQREQHFKPHLFRRDSGMWPQLMHFDSNPTAKDIGHSSKLSGMQAGVPTTGSL